MTTDRPNAPVDHDDLLAETTLAALARFQEIRRVDGLESAVIIATATHGASLAFLQCEVGVDGVRKILDAAIADNDRQRARDKSLAGAAA